jgi:hypothetical protein
MMEGTNRKEYEIKIQVQEGAIILGRDHAVAAYAGEPVTWTCPGHIFAVQFPVDAPFEVVNRGHKSILQRKGAVIPSLPYKYTIAVYDEQNKQVLILDPVYIDIPPRG